MDILLMQTHVNGSLATHDLQEENSEAIDICFLTKLTPHHVFGCPVTSAQI